MHQAPYSVVKFGDKWAILVCGASVICCARRAIAIQSAIRARELLDAFETGSADADDALIPGFVNPDSSK